MIVCSAISTLQPVLVLFRRGLGLTGNARSKSRKTSSKLPLGEEIQMYNFETIPNKRLAVENQASGPNESSDQLVGGVLPERTPSAGVGVELTYDRNKYLA